MEISSLGIYRPQLNRRLCHHHGYLGAAQKIILKSYLY